MRVLLVSVSSKPYAVRMMIVPKSLRVYELIPESDFRQNPQFYTVEEIVGPVPQVD